MFRNYRNDHDGSVVIWHETTKKAVASAGVFCGQERQYSAWRVLQVECTDYEWVDLCQITL